MSILDISPLLNSRVAVWPGDVPFRRRESLRIRQGDSVNLSSVEFSLHIGAHADAPSHYREEGLSIDCLPLEVFMGRARLIVLQGEGPVGWEELAPVLGHPPPRVLVCAHPWLDPEEFPRRIRHFLPECAGRLAGLGVRLLGTDAPSVDPLDSAELAAHRALGESGIMILENLRLAGIAAGDYELIALPLPIEGGDASPVRAVLRSLDEDLTP